MKKLLSLILAAIMLAASLASCASVAPSAAISANIRITSSDAGDAAAYLTARLGERLTSRVVLGTDAAGYGIALDALEDDGYVIRSLGDEVALFARTTDGLDRAVRKYAKMTEDGTVSDVTYHEGYRVKSLTVCGTDVSAFAVVVDDDADYAMNYAAAELVKYVAKACGAKLATYTASEYSEYVSTFPVYDVPEGVNVDPPYSRPIRLTVDYPALGDEAFRITVTAGAITIAGGRYRGCLYGVYDLLEDIGWRFLCSPNDYEASPEIDYLYESEHVDLTSALDREEHASVAYRNIHGIAHNAGTLNNKYRGDGGGAIAPYGFTGVACHGLQSYGWLQNEGYTTSYANQPCFTDPDVIACAIDGALAEVERRLAAGQQIGREIVTIDVSQYDSSNFCVCSRCQKVKAEEGTTSGAVLRFTNAVADALNENYPGLYAAMLAYAGTNAPPAKTKPRDNVRISYCIYVGSNTITCSAHCVTGEECEPGKHNGVYWNEVEGWSAICSNRNLDVWYYPFNCYGVALCSPMTDVHYENLRALTSGQINGIHLDDDNWSQGITMDPMLSYVGSKMMWNRDITKNEYDALVREWFDMIYGEAGDLLYGHMRQMEVAASLTGCWCAFSSAAYEKVDYGYLADHFDEWWALYHRAVAAADSAREQEYVERYFAGVLFMGVGVTYDARYTNGTDAERAELAERYTETYRLFRKYGLMSFNNYGEQYYAPDTLVLEDNPFDTWSRPKGLFGNGVY